MGRVKNAFLSWSGGKDSYMALETAIDEGYRITHLLTMFDETGLRSRSHAVKRELIERQASALGLELVTANASWADYESVFVETISGFANSGIEFGIFGDIYLNEHREWEEKVCQKAGLTAVLPLWEQDTTRLAHRFFEHGRSIVICVDGKFLGAEHCGREYSAKFLDELPSGVDPCGENGEFHTFVFDGKLFSAAVNFEINRNYEHLVKLPDGSELKYFYTELA